MRMLNYVYDVHIHKGHVTVVRFVAALITFRSVTGPAVGKWQACAPMCYRVIVK
jgi:hypothetical protein